MGDYFKFLYTTASIKKIESELTSSGIASFLLMMRAARAACEHLLSRSVNDITIICGKGNRFARLGGESLCGNPRLLSTTSL